MEEEKQEMTWCYSLQSNSNWVISTALVVGWSQSANRVAALHSGIRARFRIGLFLPNETPTKFSTYMLEWVGMIFTSIPKLVDRWNVSSFHFHLPFSLLPSHPLSLIFSLCLRLSLKFIISPQFISRRVNPVKGRDLLWLKHVTNENIPILNPFSKTFAHLLNTFTSDS